MVEDITTIVEVGVPQNLTRDFKKLTPWPKGRHAGKTEILIGMEQLSIHPKLIEINNNLAVFKSQFSTNTFLGGTQKKIKVERTRLSQSCTRLRSSVVATDQGCSKSKGKGIFLS